MKCSQCGFEAAQDNLFCPQCGERLTQIEAPTGVFSARILPALKDPLFLVVCILLSVSCLMSLAAGSVPLINILITVFLWLTYVKAQNNVADAAQLRCVSGAVYAQYVINYVVAGLILVVGVIFAIAFNIVTHSMNGFWESLLSEVADAETVATLMSILPSVSGIVILVACVLAAAITIVLNIFVMRYLHRFAQSVYRSIQQEENALKYTNIAMILLFILGGLEAISCLSSLVALQFGSLVASASSGGSAILSGLLIHKYLNQEA